MQLQAMRPDLQFSASLETPHVYVASLCHLVMPSAAVSS